MRFHYTLEMTGLNIHGEKFDRVIIDWEDEGTQDEVMEYSQKWVTTPNFLTSRMNGLCEVGKSSLTIEPVGAEVL